MMKITDLSHLF